MTTIRAGDFWVAEIPYTSGAASKNVLLDCLENSLLLAKTGHLSDQDAKKIREVWKIHIKPQF